MNYEAKCRIDHVQEYSYEWYCSVHDCMFNINDGEECDVKLAYETGKQCK